MDQARFTIDGTPSQDPTSGDRIFEAVNGQTISCTLEVNPSPALSVRFEVFDPTDLESPLASKDAPLVNWNENGQHSILLGNVNDTVTLDLPALVAPPASSVHSYIVRCTVATAGDGTPQSQQQVFERLVVIRSLATTPSVRKTVPSESTEARARAWSDSINDLIDAMANVTAVASSTLQAAYVQGNTITVTSADGPVALFANADSTDALTISRGFAGAGKGIGITMLVATTEAALGISHAGTGAGVGIEQLNDGVALDILATGAAKAMHVDVDGESIVDINADGSVLIEGGTDQTVAFQSRGTGHVSVGAQGDGNVTIGAVGSGQILIGATGGGPVQIAGGVGTILQALAGDLVLDSVAGEVQLSHVSGTTRVQGAAILDKTLAANGQVDIVNSTDIANALNVTRSFAGLGVGIQVIMGGSTTGSGLAIDSQPGATGSALTVDVDGTTAVFDVSGSGAVGISTPAGEGVTIASTGGAGADISIVSSQTLGLGGDGIVSLASISANVLITSVASTVDISGTVINMSAAIGDATAILNLDTSGGGSNGATSKTFVGTRNPDGLVTGAVGDLYRSSRGTAHLNQDSATLWAELSKLTDGYVRGMETQSISATQATIAVGTCRSDDNQFDIIAASTLTAAITASGANGLDTGSEASDTWYSIWAIGDTSGVNPTASLLSLSSTAPTLPAGYDAKRRVGWLYNDFASDVRPFVSIANGRQRQVYYQDTPWDELTVFVDQEPTTWTVADCSEFVPPTSRFCEFDVAIGAGNSDYVEFRTPGGSNIGDDDGRRIYGEGTGNGSITTIPGILLSATQTIEFRRQDTSGPGATLYIYSYREDI